MTDPADSDPVQASERAGRKDRLARRRSVITKVFAIIGAVATGLGLITGGIEGWDLFTTWRRNSLDQRPLVRTEERVVLSPGQSPPRSLIANTITVPAGEFILEPGTSWLANRIEFEPDATLHVTDVRLVARDIVGGVIDASGSAGETAGAPGGNGGQVFVAAFRAEGLRISASGGSGAPGRTGNRGSDGRNGRCDGFGGYRGAGAGGPGEDGQPGGNAGSGGTVSLRLVVESNIQVTAEGGRPGAGGPGGVGGRGGRGCVGLGGSQTNAKDGIRGGDGDTGASADPGTIDRLPITSEEFIRAVEVASSNPLQVSRTIHGR